MKTVPTESRASPHDRHDGRRLAAVFAGVILAMTGAGVWFYQKADVPEAFAAWRDRSVPTLALIFGFVIAAAVVSGLIWQRKTKFYRYTRSLIEASLDPLVAISPSGKITDVNTSTETATGRTRPDLIGTDFADYFTEPEKARDGYEQVFREGSVRDYPLELRHSDGSVTPVLYNASVYRNELGEVVGVFAAARDITERKRAEDALRRLNRELRAISNCNQTLIRAEDEQTLLKNICRIVCDEAGYRMAWVGYAQNDDAKTVRPEAWTGREEGYLATADITWADTERGRGPTGTAIRTGETVYIQNFATAPEVAPWREKALQRGYLSSIALPLKDESAKIFGALTVYSSETNAFTPEEIRILEELAVDLAFGISVLRARAERKQVEEEREQYYKFFTLSTDAMGIADPFGCFKRVNPAFVKLTGFSESELVSKPFLEFVLPEDRQKTAEEMEQQVNVRPSLNFENRFLRRDGSLLFLCWTAYFDWREGVTYATARDITERKRVEEKLSHLAAIVESSDDAIIGKTLDERILSWNKGAERIYGYTAGEVVGHSVAILVPPGLMEELAAIMDGVKRGEGVEHFETTRVRKDGQIIHVALTISPIKDASGQIVGASTIARDITEHKRAEEEIRKLNRYTRSLIEASLDPAVTISPTGKITDVNMATEAATGRTRTELIGTDFSDYFTEPGKARDGYEQVFREGSVRDYPLELRHRNGGSIPVLYNATVYRNEAGEVVGVFAAARDITELKRAEEEIQKLNQELEKRVAARTAQLELANNELESFSYSVSHDLRAPLRGIDGFSRILEEDYSDKLDEKGRKTLASVRAASQRMALLIDDILQLSRLSRAPLQLLPVDLSVLAASVADELKKAEPDRGVKFVIEPGWVAFADGNLMRIVLDNLIGNAWKFTVKQSAAKIEFGRTIHEGVPAYFVRDNGVGFDMQYVSKLFSAFQRLHTVAEFPGTGIGLATVQRVIRRHGGKVWIEGGINEGATAYFSIPQPESTI